MKALREMNEATGVDVVLDGEWSQHRLQQQRMRWVEMGKLAGQRIEEMQKQGKLAQLFTAEETRVA
ncbi:hypothetical protein TDB9533_03799 [Thalassocella blandensis]|nr:hypothetical protein TDB9533_03799 [Thalassocella blandensis]